MKRKAIHYDRGDGFARCADVTEDHGITTVRTQVTCPFCVDFIRRDDLADRKHAIELAMLAGSFTAAAGMLQAAAGRLRLGDAYTASGLIGQALTISEGNCSEFAEVVAAINRSMRGRLAPRRAS